MFLMVDLVGVVFFELAVGVAGDALKDNGIDTVDETRDGDDDLLLDGGVHHVAVDNQAVRAVNCDTNIAEILVKIDVDKVLVCIGLHVVGAVVDIQQTF